MRKAALYLFSTGTVVLIVWSLLFPVPDVTPVKHNLENESNESANQPPSPGPENQDASPEAEIEMGSFIFPYYKKPSDHKPKWVFRGDQGKMKKGKSKQVQVTDPTILFFSEKQNVESGSSKRTTVRITGRNGKKLPDNTAFVKEQVRVETNEGSRLKTEELYTDFDTNRLRTNPENDVYITRPGIEIYGTGFHGNTRLHKFTVQNNVRVNLDTGRIFGDSGSASVSPKNSRPPSSRYYIVCEGPLEMEKIGGDKRSAQEWNVSMFGDVYLYRALPNGTLRQRSNVLHTVLAERQTNDNQHVKSSTNSNGKNSGNSNSRKLRVKSMEAQGQVHIQDPQFDIRTSHMNVRRKDRKEIIRLRGDQQTIKINTVSDNARNNIQINVSGRGKLIRPRERYLTSNTRRDPTPPSGHGQFQGRVRTEKQQSTLFSRYLRFSFRPGDSQKQDTTQNQPSLTRTGNIQIQSIHAKENVLFLREDLVSRGTDLTWKVSSGDVHLQGTPAKSTDLRNAIKGNNIHFNRKQEILTARGNAHSLLYLKKGNGFNVTGESSSNRSLINQTSLVSTGPSRVPWNIHAERIIYQLSSRTGDFHSIRARNNVRISSRDTYQGTGQSFVLNKTSSIAKLKGGADQARIWQGSDQAFASEFQFHMNRKQIVLKGQKQIRLKRNRTGKQTNSKKRNGPGYILTGAPTIIDRSEGTLRILGSCRIKRSGSWARSERLFLTFDPKNQNQLKTLHALGNVFLYDRKGTAYGDYLKWSRARNQIQVRGQPSATVHHKRGRARYEIYTIWNDWQNFKGESYKWRRHGETKVNKQ